MTGSSETGSHKPIYQGFVGPCRYFLLVFSRCTHLSIWATTVDRGLAITTLSVPPLRGPCVVWTASELGVDAAALLLGPVCRHVAVRATSVRGIFAGWKFIFCYFHDADCLKGIRGIFGHDVALCIGSKCNTVWRFHP